MIQAFRQEVLSILSWKHYECHYTPHIQYYLLKIPALKQNFIAENLFEFVNKQ